MRLVNKISGKLALCFYIFMLYYLWHLCQYGGVKSHIVLMAIGFAGCISMLVTWMVSKSIIGKTDVNRKKISRKFFYMEIAIFIAASIWFAGKIVYSAIPYHGALSWKIDEWMRKKEVKLEHTNLFEDGADGFLQDIDEALNLPKELYIANQCQIKFSKDGTIQYIYAFLYGKNEKGEKKTYLIDYNAEDSHYMTVWIDGNANGEYEEDEMLSPMFAILEQSDWLKQVENWAESLETEQVYEILYLGRRTFSTKEGLEYVSGDVDGDGLESGVKEFSLLDGGGKILGYEVSLHIPALTDVTPVRYIMEPEYITPEELKKENTIEQSENAINTQSWTVDQSDGSMYFFLNEKIGWHMVITDAAAGSRFYELDYSTDGGNTWTRINTDPFDGKIGVTEGLIFYDESFGIAGLTNASGSYSHLYLTRDGGKTFEQINLPMEQVTDLPEIADEIGYAIEDYAYLHMPEIDGNTWKILLTTESSESDGIIFQSQDQGATWEYVGIK